MLGILLRTFVLICGVTLAHPSLSSETIQLDASAMRNLVERSYQYIAMFNVNNKLALDESSPTYTGGYNRVYASTQLLDHTNKFIARPNNDTLYAIAMVDVTQQPMLLRLPAFDSVYVSLMVTSYDHYVMIPLSNDQGDFAEPATVLFYSQRTPNFEGGEIDGVDKLVETTGDFVSVILRVMPHAAEPTRLQANLSAMEEVDLVSLSEFVGDADEIAEYAPWSTPLG